MYHFNCLRFGLASAPHHFTKLMKAFLAVLRPMGLRMICYLDDMLILAQDQQLLLKEGKTAIFLLEHLGLVLNVKKSHLVPVQ